MTRSKCIVLLMLLIISAPLYSQHDRFSFQLYEGNAQLSRTGGGTWLALQAAQPTELAPGDMLELDSSGRGQIFYPDGTIVRVKNSAVLTVLRDGLQLRLGNAWFQVRRRSDIFKIQTPLASCHVLGTSFDVDVNRFGRTQVRVFSGIVAVRANEDTRNRQLVLQSDMQTVVSDSSRVADHPDRFQSSTVMTSLESEWSSRALLRPVVPETRVFTTGLPPIREEIDTAPEGLPRVEEIIDGIYIDTPEEMRIPTIARQRAGYLKAMRDQRLEQESTIGISFNEYEKMRVRQHGFEIGHYHRPDSMISDREDLEREYNRLRNRLLRVQSQIRQLELQASSKISQNNPSPAHQRRITSIQLQMQDLIEEQRIIIWRLRDVQARKK